jgi:methionine-rich copper-binding protein CopC
MLRIAPVARLVFVVASLIGTAANAHPELRTTDPPVGAAIPGSPKEIRMSFTENVIPKFSGVEVRDQSGKLIVTATATADPNDKKQLVVPIQEPLPPGAYNVDWHAVSVDTHRVQGRFSFPVERRCSKRGSSALASCITRP